MMKTSFRDYLAWRQRWPDSLSLLAMLGIDLFEPSPEEMRRWVKLHQGKHYRHQDDDILPGIR